MKRRNRCLNPEASNEGAQEIQGKIRKRFVGQDEAVAMLARTITGFQADNSTEGRPQGVFLLLGPTGTGKTHFVEALAEALHGKKSRMLRVDCGEMGINHEVARLVGAPPGYLGHRETHPVFTQDNINGVTSEKWPLSIILFDEIEKAHESLRSMLLGILDKATLRLGDNRVSTFENSLIFMTSNLGAAEMRRELGDVFGFATTVDVKDGRPADTEKRLKDIAIAAVKRKFTPEFFNRIDYVIVFQPFTDPEVRDVLDLEIAALQDKLSARKKTPFVLTVTQPVREKILEKAQAQQYGARNLRRELKRQVIDPLSNLLATGQIDAYAAIRADYSPQIEKIVFIYDTYFENEESMRNTRGRRKKPVRDAA